MQECARAIGVIASEACSLRGQALQQPHLAKMLGQLRKSLQVPCLTGTRQATIPRRGCCTGSASPGVAPSVMSSLQASYPAQNEMAVQMRLMCKFLHAADPNPKLLRSLRWLRSTAVPFTAGVMP